MVFFRVSDAGKRMKLIMSMVSQPAAPLGCCTRPRILVGDFIFASRFTWKLGVFYCGPAWTRTRDLFLIRDNSACCGCLLLFKNACKSPLFTSMVVLHVYCCSRALSSNCRQSSDLRRTDRASQGRQGLGAIPVTATPHSVPVGSVSAEQLVIPEPPRKLASFALYCEAPAQGLTLNTCEDQR